MNLALWIDRLTTPTDSSSSIDRVNYVKWERSSRMILMIIKSAVFQRNLGVSLLGF